MKRFSQETMGKKGGGGEGRGRRTSEIVVTPPKVAAVAYLIDTRAGWVAL